MGRKRNKRQRRSIQNPAVPLSAKAIEQYIGSVGSKANAGVRVTPKSALSCSPVWSAIDRITSDIARLPFVVKRFSGDGRTRTIQRMHPVHKLLNRWTGEMTPNLWIVRVLGHALLYGNGYTRLLWSGSRLLGFQWLRRDQVEPEWESGRFYYLVNYDTGKDGNGRTERVDPADMIHLAGLTLDEFGGMSLIDCARNTIGRHLAGEHYTDDFLHNNATPSGWFEHPAEMSPEAQQNFLWQVERRHAGAGQRFRLGILEEGMKFNPVGISPKDAMLIELMGWTVKDVARFFNLPPHKLGDDSKASYNSLEQENDAYFDSTLGKWVDRLQHEINAKCFLEEEADDGYYAELLIDQWMRADTQSRFTAYSVAIQWGIMSRNEVRELEGLNPVDGGDDYLTPATHTTQGQEENSTELVDEPGVTSPVESDADEDTGEASRSKLYMRDVLQDRMQAAARLIANSAQRAAKKERNFLAAINGFQDKHGGAIDGMLRAAVRAVGGDEQVQEVIDGLFAKASELMLEAAECPPEQLQTRVRDAGERLKSYCGDAATDLVYGERV